MGGQPPAFQRLFDEDDFVVIETTEIETAPATPAPVEQRTAGAQVLRAHHARSIPRALTVGALAVAAVTLLALVVTGGGGEGPRPRRPDSPSAKHLVAPPRHAAAPPSDRGHRVREKRAQARDVRGRAPRRLADVGQVAPAPSTVGGGEPDALGLGESAASVNPPDFFGLGS
jgi:hypothetical protein